MMLKKLISEYTEQKQCFVVGYYLFLLSLTVYELSAGCYCRYCGLLIVDYDPWNGAYKADPHKIDVIAQQRLWSWMWLRVWAVLAKGLWVVREPQKRAQDLGIKLQRSAAASLLPSPTKCHTMVRTCFVLSPQVFGQRITGPKMLTEDKFFSSFPLPTALILNLWLLGAILAANSIFTSRTPLTPSWTNENSLSYNTLFCFILSTYQVISDSIFFNFWILCTV